MIPPIVKGTAWAIGLSLIMWFFIIRFVVWMVGRL